MILFKDPAAFQILKAAGIAVFKQQIGDQLCYTAEDSPAVRIELRKNQTSFDLSSVLMIDRMMF